MPGYYRTDIGVDIDTMDGGGYCVTDIKSGEWTEYPVRIDTAGTYVLELGLASNMDSKNFHIEMNGVDISGAIDVPNTGGTQIWDTLKIPLNLFTTFGQSHKLMD